MSIGTIDVQRLLAAAGYYNGDIDGDAGPKLFNGIAKLLIARNDDLPSNFSDWSWDRRGIAALQLVLKYAGYDQVGAIDGLVGTMTQYALGLYEHKKIHGVEQDNTWRDDDFESTDEHEVFNKWPRQRSMNKFYGKAGGNQCTAGKVNMPFPMKIAWDLDETITRFSCHEKVADSAERVYRKIAGHYSPEDISRHGFDLFGGCYNYRRKRGGRTLSTHAYGIAIDHDPIRNQLKWKRDRAYLDAKACEPFWEFWEEEGWYSLGRGRNFDWMHVQAALL